MTQQPDKTINLKQLVLGTHAPQRMIAPIVADNLRDVLMQGRAIVASPAEIAEWRLDYLGTVVDFDQLVTTGQALQAILGNIPLIVTNRTAAEGGKTEYSEAAYIASYRALIEAEVANAIDVEFSQSDHTIAELTHLTNNSDTKLILSHHDFKGTPLTNDLIFLYSRMAKLNPDMVKLAVTPNSREDVLHLMNATVAADRQIEPPIISMSMGDLGKITRVAGELFGSVATFASVVESSAPGQLSAEHLRTVMELINLN
ncbi:type I 3-dehydroquinate dehydratase [Paucilactobacillus wasatchensis]|uniref:3-dehydroquinate dehydratase n=1 Tax=Paucilactobacillus wasatchensis TaxID=1335616 RepID=A0A0D1A728_9LACO|nr:type I 3-dehydroquinate dehydratase [Paucilactobacillus wasatchensis]KIS03675.1 3-dehydroquinate dehydratase I [Paucilactobacillus wasatchensis]